MSETNKPIGNAFSETANGTLWPGIDSRFRLIIVAGKRTKQLLHGATARVEINPLRKRGTSVALEEVKRGLVRFNIVKSEK
jgi:DNA-directed RNA polymerase omega subunit